MQNLEMVHLGHEMELYSVLQLQMIYLKLGIVSKGFSNHNFQKYQAKLKFENNVDEFYQSSIQ